MRRAPGLKTRPTCRFKRAKTQPLVRRGRDDGLRRSPWRWTPAEREEVVANRADLPIAVGAELREVGLWIIRPELRHPRARLNLERRLHPFHNPVRLQAVDRHPQIGRKVRRRLILRNRTEDVTLLASQQLEELLPGRGFTRRANHLVR